MADLLEDVAKERLGWTIPSRPRRLTTGLRRLRTGGSRLVDLIARRRRKTRVERPEVGYRDPASA
jgi:hypothetical protein